MNNKWVVREEAKTDPIPIVLRCVLNGDGFKHAVVALDSEGCMINALVNGVEYMEAFHGLVFKIDGVHHLGKEFTNEVIDADHVYVYDKRTQKFVVTKEEDLKDIMEI